MHIFFSWGTPKGDAAGAPISKAPALRPVVTGRTSSASFALVRTSTLLFALARAGPRDAIKAERKRARGRL